MYDGRRRSLLRTCLYKSTFSLDSLHKRSFFPSLYDISTSNLGVVSNLRKDICKEVKLLSSQTCLHCQKRQSTLAHSVCSCDIVTTFPTHLLVFLCRKRRRVKNNTACIGDMIADRLCFLSTKRLTKFLSHRRRLFDERSS